MNISVVVPTYKRLHDLRRCLSALDQQTSLPYEVIVVARSSDFETLTYIHQWTAQKASYSRKLWIVTLPGQVHALVQGVEAATGDVVAFTDDDSAPSSNWLRNMAVHYQNPRVGGVGGRDILRNHPVLPLQRTVGKLTWYGKLIGNHHLGEGPPREVDVLKGVNMSFRTQLVQFSPFLRGTGGPETHNEVGVCLRVKRLGYALIYDPEVVVNHYAVARVDSEQRTQLSTRLVRHSAFNMQMSLLTWTPWHQKLSRLAFATLVGDKAYPGLARLGIAICRREIRVIKSFAPAQLGFLIAFMYWLFRAGSDNKRRASETPTPRHTVTTEDV
ncbi:glycosyltransferase family 2 protein [Alicyclobacillus sp. ALC3]|uniref:glycosyltransferase family 2 protein n=1 Tax=Alicyclobacillus sp. ALC3 TaxID=2796143 RepID=UPI002379C642|nr:glycosyltransferase family 2 protein [Alicyclobacillus sp. ALC3]WDL95259.1 glycosyltransferase family 2 protein [Alicyclobacillus sp. ALC3]